MIASLYLCSKTFAYNGSDTSNEVYNKIINLNGLINFVRNGFTDDNIFYLNKNELLETEFLPEEITLNHFLSGDDTVNRDIRNILFPMFGKCSDTRAGFEDTLEYLTLEDEENCNALVVLNLINDFCVNHQVISTIEGWYKFRRFYLGKYPKNTDFFIDECDKYFKNLIFHPDNKRSVREVLMTHSKKIVIYLAALNDYFVDNLRITIKTFPDFLNEFAITHNLDDASFEGEKKDVFNFVFYEGTDKEFTAYCEPHLKIYKNDNDEPNNHCRIYFMKPTIENEDNSIHVGYIGPHL